MEDRSQYCTGRPSGAEIMGLSVLHEKLASEVFFRIRDASVIN
jgi:hypothetical protein